MFSTDEHIDEYLKEKGIELLPHQRKIFDRIARGNAPRIIIPTTCEPSTILGIIRLYEVADEIGFLEELLEE